MIIKEIWNKIPKWGMIVLLSLLIVEIVTTSYIPTWKKSFFDILAQKDVPLFINSLLVYGLLAGLLTLSQSFKIWLGQLLSLFTREGLTNLLLNKWSKVGMIDGIDNPCQRINEDCRVITDSALSVIIEIIISFAIVAILITSSYSNVKVLVLSLVYTLVICTGATLFKNPLVNSNIEWQKSEAAHRLSLSEITLGVSGFTTTPNDKFEVVKNFFRRYIAITRNYAIFNSAQVNLTPLLAYAMLASAYIYGTDSLGDLMKDVSTFELIVINSTIFVQLYPKFTNAVAAYRRINEFYLKLCN